jgi:hypothetical protein
MTFDPTFDTPTTHRRTQAFDPLAAIYMTGASSVTKFIRKDRQSGRQVICVGDHQFLEKSEGSVTQ